MCLERSADGGPRFVAHPWAISQIQFNKAFIFSEGASDFKDLSVTILVGNARGQPLQRTISAYPLREDVIVNSTKIKLGGALIPSQDFC